MGYIPRGGPGFADVNLQNKILDVKTNPLICRNFSQGDYSNPAFQPLKAAPGEFISMSYQENGHVTDPTLVANKPFRSGNVYVYGTLDHTADAKLNDVRNVWTVDGTGGNQKGKLLATHFFDDGQCYQNRGEDGSKYPIFTARKAKFAQDELHCQTDLQLPADLATSGTYTLYWVWDWPTNNSMPGNTTEIYTSCAQIELGEKQANSSTSEIKFAVAAKDIKSAAVSSQLVKHIEALTLGVGSSSPPAVTGVATATGSAPVKTKTTSAKASKTTKSGKNGVKTVTVTAEATTVTQYQTVTVGNGGATPKPQLEVTSTLRTTVKTNSPAPTTKVPVTSVKPFLKARVTGRARRAADLA